MSCGIRYADADVVLAVRLCGLEITKCDTLHSQRPLAVHHLFRFLLSACGIHPRHFRPSCSNIPHTVYPTNPPVFARPESTVNEDSVLKKETEVNDSSTFESLPGEELDAGQSNLSCNRREHEERLVRHQAYSVRIR